jgi:NitT/TauT family transport system substrate-binding protein
MKKLSILVCTLVIMIFLVGCSQTQQQDTTPSEKIKIGYLPLTDHLTGMVADSQDMFSKENIELVKFSSWPALAEALASGQIDGAHMLNTLGIKMVTNGFKGKTVVLSHRGDIALVTSKDIADVQQLKGKTIAVPSRFSSHFFMLHNYLTKNGFDMDKDVQILDVAPPDFVSTMASGGVDAFIGSEPFPTIAESKGIGKTFALWDEMEIEGLNGLDCTVVFNDDTIEQNPDVVQEYTTAIIQAGQFIESNPKEAAESASSYMLNIDPELMVKAIDEPRHRSSYDSLLPKAEEYQKLQDYMVSIGSLKEGIDINAFVDDSFARKAYAELGQPVQE